MKSVKSVLDIIKSGSSFLADKSIESPRLNMELMLCSVLNCERISLYTNHDRPLNENEVSELRNMVKRRAKREPLQYILGKTAFLDFDILLDNSNVLIPRPETEQLCELASELFEKNTPLEILDIGCGSGCISIALAKSYPKANVTGIDISEDAVLLSRKNAANNNIQNAAFFAINIFEIDKNKKYDLILSNPPYISLPEYAELEPELSFEPKKSLTDGSDGLTFYRFYVSIYKSILADGGIFVLEIAYNQGEIVRKMFLDAGYEAKIIKDFAGCDRIIVGNC